LTSGRSTKGYPIRDAWGHLIRSATDPRAVGAVIVGLMPALLRRWLRGLGAPADGLSWRQLKRRTRRQQRAGHIRRAGLVSERMRANPDRTRGGLPHGIRRSDHPDARDNAVEIVCTGATSDGPPTPRPTRASPVLGTGNLAGFPTMSVPWVVTPPGCRSPCSWSRDQPTNYGRSPPRSQVESMSSISDAHTERPSHD
jgi:hypothetical protein